MQCVLFFGLLGFVAMLVLYMYIVYNCSGQKYPFFKCVFSNK